MLQKQAKHFDLDIQEIIINMSNHFEDEDNQIAIQTFMFNAMKNFS